jgi:hypothetical protein
MHSNRFLAVAILDSYSSPMAGTRRLHNVMVGACHAARARYDAPAPPDCLMARMLPSKPSWQNCYHKTPPCCACGGLVQAPKGQLRRQQPEPRPLGPLGLRRQHTQPKPAHGDTVSHLPDCCSLDALVSDAEWPYLNRPFLSGSPFPIPTFRPAKLVTWQPVIPNGS